MEVLGVKHAETPAHCAVSVLPLQLEAKSGSWMDEFGVKGIRVLGFGW